MRKFGLPLGSVRLVVSLGLEGGMGPVGAVDVVKEGRGSLLYILLRLNCPYQPEPNPWSVPERDIEDHVAPDDGVACRGTINVTVVSS